jgi:hypothetical protein
VGGLALAALLTKAGKKVVVLESHYRAGGCTHAFSEVGDRGDVFDTGIHYVGMGVVLRRLLSHVSAPGAPMRFAAMGSPADGYTYDEIDLGRVAAPAHAPPPPEKQGQSQGQAAADQGGGHHSRHARSPTGYGTSFDLDCEEEESYDDEEKEAAAAPVFTVHEVAAEAGDEDHVTGGDRRVVVRLRKGALVESLVGSFPEERDGIEAYVAAVRSGGFGPGGSRRVLSGLNGLMVAKFVPLGWGWPGAALRRWLLRRTEVDARETASAGLSQVHSQVPDLLRRPYRLSSIEPCWDLYKITCVVKSGIHTLRLGGGRAVHRRPRAASRSHRRSDDRLEPAAG